MSIGVIALVLIAAAGPADGPLPSHLAEIKIFASAVVVARTAKEQCRGATVDDSTLEGMRRRLHIVEADFPAYVPEARAVADVLKRGLAEAPSREAWCASAYRLYGPDGTIIRGLLGQ